MDISVIIVSYNVKAFLEKCLVSVLRARGDLDVEVIVVDNNSVDDSVQFVKDHFLEVDLIENKDNVGFSRANNIGIERAKGDFVLILNPDTVVNEDTFLVCHKFMQNNINAGIVGVKMLDGTGTYLPESKRGIPSPMTSFFKLTGLNKLFPKSNLFNAYYMGGLDAEMTNPVPVLTGAFMFIRKLALDEAGAFDEDYFMYGEDIDLSCRILSAGYENYYLPETSIIHYKGESTKRSSIEYVKTFYNAMLIFVSKHYSGPSGAVLKLFLKLGIFIRGVLSWLRRFILDLIVPAIDITIMVGVVLLIKQYWADFYFNDSEHFESGFNSVNLPLYVGLWTGSLALFGAYDKGRSYRRILSGILFGTIAILIVYALISSSFKSSRAVILIAAVIIAVALSLWTTLFQFVFGASRNKRVAIVGSVKESERIMELLNRIDPEVEIVGAISTSKDLSNPIFIANIDMLETVVQEYRIEELIFTAQDVEFGEISKWMTRIGSNVKYKIASQESDDIVGSDSKLIAGQLYTSEIQFSIDDTLNKRNKRIFDILVAMLILILSPIRVLFPGGKRAIFRASKVLWGEYTWVSYDLRDTDLQKLPILRPGILSPAMFIRSQAEIAQEVHMINYLYAREYSVWRDVDLMFRANSNRDIQNKI